ncbi:M23 family metallopeptidase [Bacillus sp. H-16]|uniref:M23 family metallopeptidase n=1 Tax=Alteribacter salitolerans TaxID=2912333 RepID=UPI001966CD7A|nr:M23 family metallopeptidase [Alteribacter salitolerans]MBM7095390.1 M23 family metallopeptidase [Alteribacter salitolerans]
MFTQTNSVQNILTYIGMAVLGLTAFLLLSFPASAQIPDDDSVEADQSEGISTLYHVHYGDTFVGFVDDKSEVYDIVDEKVDAFDEDDEVRLTTAEELQVIPERVFHAKALNDVTIEKLEEILEIKAEAHELTVDGEHAGYLSAAFEKEDFIRFWKLEYVTEDELDVFEKDEDVELEEGDTMILDIYLSDDLESEEVLVDPDELQSKEELVEILETGAHDETEYEVEEGDVLGTIAADHDLSVKELLDANEDLDEENSISEGDTLTVYNSAPLLHVVVEKVKKESKEIPYETKTEEDSDMDKGKTEVKQSGEEGEKVVEKKIISENGSTVSTETVEEETVSEPEDRIVIKGTKETASRGSGKLEWPAVGGYISSPKGQRWGRLHKGIDIARPSSPEIRAAESGTVTSAKTESGYGKTVRIRHSNGLETLYAHLDSMSVSAGDSVSRGEDIGIMGETGTATGVHLHFEVYKDGELEDPEDYVSK